MATQPVAMSSVVLSLVIANLLVACAPPTAQTPTVYRLPWLDASGNYSIQDVELKTFQDPDSLRGSVGEVLIDPRLTSDSVESNEPIGRWIREGSVMRPADFVTQQAATLYAHLEKLHEIDNATGVGAKLKGPARVGLLVRISESALSPIILNNAVYDGRLDALFIVPYTGEYLPISQNAGIIGHEHFHRVFQAIVMTPMREVARNGGVHDLPCAGGIIEKTEEPSVLADVNGGLVSAKVLNQSLLRGVNEGFADFWGWAYSQDENFVARSLGDREDAARRLDKQMVSLPQKAAFRNSLLTVDRFGAPIVKSEGGRIAAAYKIGTEYARVLRGVVEALVTKGMLSRPDAVAKVRLALAQSLETLSSDLVMNWKREELEPELMLKPFFTKLIRMSSAGPATLDAADATVACGELTRLGASTQMMSGLCEVKPQAKPKNQTPPNGNPQL